MSNYVAYRNEIALLDPNDLNLSFKIDSIGKKYGISHDIQSGNNVAGGKYHLTNDNNKTNSVNHIYNSGNSKPSNYLIKPIHENMSQLNINSFANPFTSIASLHSDMAKFQDQFTKHFDSMKSNSQWIDLEKEFPSETHNSGENGYTKYVSSYTSYDNNGNKKKETISGVEKLVDGKKQVSKKIKTYDNGIETVEQVFPDGRRIKILNDKIKY